MQLETFKRQYHYAQATPMMQQYLDVKFAHLDCLVLFRLGDFYELFFEDAVLAARLLGITLTKRGKNGLEEISMCGVPYHALESYLPKLVDEGYKVAICDQLETPEAAKLRAGYKAVVKRNVVRIITPGTIIEEALITSNAPNYLVSLILSKHQAAICYADLSITEISVMSINLDQIIDQLARLQPKEILLSENFRGSDIAININKLGYRISYQVDSFFAFKKCQQVVLSFYNIASSQAIGQVSEQQISSLGSIIEYLSLTQKQNIPQLPLPKIINAEHFISIDLATRRNLEITTNLAGGVKGSMLSSIDQTVTKAGGRLLYQFLSAPLAIVAEINHRLQITDFFYTNLPLALMIRQLLKNIADLERCLTRVSMNRSLPRDLLSIKDTLRVAMQIKDQVAEQFKADLPSYISQLMQPFGQGSALSALIGQAITEDAPNSLTEEGIIKYQYHPEIHVLHQAINHHQLAIETLKNAYQQATNIDTLKILYNNVLGWFIEITTRNSHKMTDAKFIHRQTTANTLRYSTAELQKLAISLLQTKHLAITLENQLYQQICQQVIAQDHLLRNIASNLSLLDIFCNFAFIADEYNYVRPALTSDLCFEVISGRHAVVEQSLHSQSKVFVSNDCQLSEDQRIWLITGPNMSGKSTFLRQNAIITILAQIGSFVPAIKSKIGVVDKIFSRIGSGDDLTKGQSTFMIEMLETSAILAQATCRSLVILDEVGRGTSTYDGVAIAWSVLEHLHNKIKCRCLFASHYHELTALSDSLPALKNYTVAIQELENSILFLHNIVEGSADKSYGVHVAQLAGLPASVISRANQILARLEKTNHHRNQVIDTTQSNNVSFFGADSSEMVNESQQIIEVITKIDLDNLSAQRALAIIRRLKTLLG